MEPTRDTLLRIFELMNTIHACDEKLRSLLMSGQAMFVYYSPRGQEAIAATTGACLRSDDYVVTTYRGLHDQVAKGVPLGPLFAEILGRSTGTCKGKGGGMHITHPASGLMVTTGVVGGGIPIANGLALATQLRGEDRVTVCNFGDGASNIGAFHEALNLAAVWQLPVIFLCQNNGYAEHTAQSDSTPVERIAQRAEAYAMAGVTVDGNDPIAMYAAVAAAVERARGGGGPTLLEATTFRFMGHFVGDDSSYIDGDELAAAMAADPVPGFRASLVAANHASEADLVAIEERIAIEVAAAAEFALSSPFPDVSELRVDVYAQEVPV